MKEQSKKEVTKSIGFIAYFFSMAALGIFVILFAASYVVVGSYAHNGAQVGNGTIIHYSALETRFHKYNFTNKRNFYAVLITTKDDTLKIKKKGEFRNDFIANKPPIYLVTTGLDIPIVRFFNNKYVCLSNQYNEETCNRLQSGPVDDYKNQYLGG